MYVTARNQESQWDVRRSLDDARKTTDQSLDDLQDTWWTENEYGQTFRSPRLFSAVLENYRSAVKAGSRLFLEDLQFYTNVIDALLGWLNNEIQLYNGGHASQWLLTYSYLMGSLNQLGAEQALCGAFHSVVCLSRREIFYHANVSFAAEATFRLYRQTFPVDRESDFRTRPHFRFFSVVSILSSGNILRKFRLLRNGHRSVRLWLFSSERDGLPRDWPTYSHRIRSSCSGNRIGTS